MSLLIIYNLHFDLSGYLESSKLGQGQRNCHGRVGVNQRKLFESSHLHSLQESANVFCLFWSLNGQLHSWMSLRPNKNSSTEDFFIRSSVKGNIFVLNIIVITHFLSVLVVTVSLLKSRE